MKAFKTITIAAFVALGLMSAPAMAAGAHHHHNHHHVSHHHHHHHKKA